MENFIAAYVEGKFNNNDSYRDENVDLKIEGRDLIISFPKSEGFIKLWSDQTSAIIEINRAKFSEQLDVVLYQNIFKPFANKSLIYDVSIVPKDHNVKHSQVILECLNPLKLYIDVRVENIDFSKLKNMKELSLTMYTSSLPEKLQLPNDCKIHISVSINIEDKERFKQAISRIESDKQVEITIDHCHGIRLTSEQCIKYMSELMEFKCVKSVESHPTF